MRKILEEPIQGYFETILLYCLKQLKGERTVYSIYHLLKGKKSAQTIQDAHLFSLTPLFRVMEPITRERLDDITGSLIARDYIYEVSSQRFLLTVKGEEALKAGIAREPLPIHLNGLKYHQTGQMLWERLSLLVQVCSHLSMKEQSYVPIQKDRGVQLWVKGFLAKMSNGQREALPGKLYKELESVLSSGRQIRPGIFVIRLSGYKRAGLTAQQSARKLDMDEFRYRLEFLDILHYLCNVSSSLEDRYPILNGLVKGGGEAPALTLTSRQTYKFIRSGYSIDEVVAARGLKRSTIEDHIVEIALNYRDFPIESYVSKEEQDKIISTISRTSTRQLKILKDQSGGMPYFKIRLVLAKLGET